jgi:2-polyprenyl-3-methyl-5-hydroxy-6-metoxy-1,4-benzoquinol methylase
MKLSTIALTQKEQEEIERLLAFSEHSPMEVTDLWKMMDIVWDEIGCDSDNLDPEKISAYYSHPVWTLNGLFIEQDDVSMGHREAIASWITNNQISNVLDYGGGFGTLARLIAAKGSNIEIDIHEPFPSQLAIAKVESFSNIHFVGSLDNSYDCLVCIDVIEHVPDPLDLFAMMVKSVKIGGFLVIANCFYPVIKCHLSSTLHFKYTFDKFAVMMGLKVMGQCPDSHATIYKKVTANAISWEKVRKLEQLSRTTFPIKELLSFALNIPKEMTKNVIGLKNFSTLKTQLKKSSIS